MAESPTSTAASAPSVKRFTTSERIGELNTIDQSVAEILSSAAEAVGILSNSSQNVNPAPKGLSAAQARFTKASSTYFSTLSAIEVRLRRQVYALEEAGLIEEGDDKDTKAGRVLGTTDLGRRAGGPLDPSWLNARADNSVEFKLRRELVDQAKEFLERVKMEGEMSQTKDADTQNVEMKE